MVIVTYNSDTTLERGGVVAITVEPGSTGAMLRVLDLAYYDLETGRDPEGHGDKHASVFMPERQLVALITRAAACLAALRGEARLNDPDDDYSSTVRRVVHDADALATRLT